MKINLESLVRNLKVMSIHTHMRKEHFLAKQVEEVNPNEDAE